MLKKILFSISTLALATMFVACGDDSSSTAASEDSSSSTGKSSSSIQNDVCTDDPAALECQPAEEPEAPEEEI